MLIVMLYLRKYYRLAYWKIVITAVLLTVSGTIGTMLLFWIESGNWGGTSFYGAIFFVPVIMTVVAIILKIPAGAMLDLCAPAECIMLALMKLRCLYWGCCAGRVMFTLQDVPIRFPSQIVELVTIVCVMMALLQFIKKSRYIDQIYAWYLILYGATRFVLNLLRDTKPFVWILPAGNFWSLISITIGILVLCLWKWYGKDTAHECNE